MINGIRVWGVVSSGSRGESGVVLGELSQCYEFKGSVGLRGLEPRTSKLSV